MARSRASLRNTRTTRPGPRRRAARLPPTPRCRVLAAPTTRAAPPTADPRRGTHRPAARRARRHPEPGPPPARLLARPQPLTAAATGTFPFGVRIPRNPRPHLAEKGERPLRPPKATVPSGRHHCYLYVMALAVPGRLVRRALAAFALVTATGIALLAHAQQPANAPTSPATTPAPAPEAALLVTDLVTGIGEEALPGKTVIVHYTGWLLDPAAKDQRGRKFDSSR